jgi:cobalamin synthase
MENPIKPDRKFLVKGIWIFVTVSAVLAFIIAIIHLIIYLVDGEMQAAGILWIVSLSIRGY